MLFVTYILLILAGAYFIFFGGFTVVSLIEGEKRAAGLSAVLTVIGTGLLVLAGLQSESVQAGVVISLTCIATLGSILLLLPTATVARLRDSSVARIDERDIMFARARLRPGSDDFNDYYAMRPENKAIDDEFRAQPGLLSPESRFADPMRFGLSAASFDLAEAMHAMVDGEPASETVALPENPERSELVKSLTKYFGAVDVGITRLKPAHLYSHVGRGPGGFGSPITLNHRYAIAFTVEMDAEIMQNAPHAPVVMESAKQYVESGRVAVQLAQAIRNWGYPARAHMDGNYRVVCPLVARDAGLGEIGRMGLLMTPKQGPRVRIAVVTTDLELVPDEDVPDESMIDFCRACGKCGDNCPSNAIAAGDRIEIDGAMRWQVDSGKCFQYWTVIGTDCGRCMSVCPYSHPDTFYHNLIRWGNRRSALFRRLAIALDDVFYGKRPKPRK